MRDELDTLLQNGWSARYGRTGQIGERFFSADMWEFIGILIKLDLNIIHWISEKFQWYVFERDQYLVYPDFIIKNGVMKGFELAIREFSSFQGESWIKAERRFLVKAEYGNLTVREVDYYAFLMTCWELPKLELLPELGMPLVPTTEPIPEEWLKPESWQHQGRIPLWQVLGYFRIGNPLIRYIRVYDYSIGGKLERRGRLKWYDNTLWRIATDEFMDELRHAFRGNISSIHGIYDPVDINYWNPNEHIQRAQRGQGGFMPQQKPVELGKYG